MVFILDTADAVTGRRDMDNTSDTVRINRYIAECGICSRREADRLICEGRVSGNGETAMPGIEVCGTDKVCVDLHEVREKKEKTVIAYYKPAGVTCTERDCHAERNVIDELGLSERVTYAGRLDRDSEGLLIMTDDGMLIHEMMSAGNFHEKEYEVELDRDISDEDIARLAGGIHLSELDIDTRPCNVRRIGKKSVNFILTQGVNRQIRRMCYECGYKVKKLCRIRIMNLKLAELRPGEYRNISGDELKQLYESCGLSLR